MGFLLGASPTRNDCVRSTFHSNRAIATERWSECIFTTRLREKLLSRKVFPSFSPFSLCLRRYGNKTLQFQLKVPFFFPFLTFLWRLIGKKTCECVGNNLELIRDSLTWRRITASLLLEKLVSLFTFVILLLIKFTPIDWIPQDYKSVYYEGYNLRQHTETRFFGVHNSKF